MMVRQKTVLGVVCVVLCVAVSAALAADAKVAELIDKMPAEGSAEGTKLTAELVKLGPDAIMEVCKMLVPPGTGDDVKARFALSGLAMYCSRPEAEAERKMYAEVLMKALKTASDNEVRAFLIRQLQLVGKDDAVPMLSGYLADDRLCESAARALLSIRTPAAVNALVQALPNAKGDRVLTLIRAVAQCRAKEAVAAIKPHAASTDANLRRAALYALANIGCTSAEETLKKATEAEDPFERARATSYYLLYAKRLAEAGNTEQCAKICRQMIETRTAPEDKNVQCAALSTLVSTVGKKALNDLLRAVDSDNKQIREAALALACGIQDEFVTVRFVNKMMQAPPEVKVEILNMLGRRGDKTAMEAILAALKDKEKPVQIAAIQAAARLGGESAVPSLIDVLKTEDADVIKTVKDVLARMPGEKVLKAVADAVPTVPPKSSIALLQILSERHARAYSAVVFAACKNEDKSVRKEAIKALGNTASPEQLPEMIGAVLLKTESSSDRSAAQKSIGSVTKRIADPAQRADAVLASLEKTSGEKRGWLIQTLPRIGGKKALDTVLREMQSDDAKIKDASVRALADWEEIEAAPKLLEIAKTTDQLPHHVLALRGYVRLVRAIRYPSERELRASKEAQQEMKDKEAQKLQMLKDALAIVKRPDEIKGILGALADVRTVESVQVIEPYLDNDAVKNEAAQAVVKIVVPRHRRDKGVVDPAVQPALKKAVPLIRDKKKKAEAEKILSVLPLPDTLNLAWRKPVKANKPQEGDREPKYAVDGDYQERHKSAWFARGWPVWLEVDLQKPAKVESAHIWFYWDGKRYYQYKIETSMDGKEWKTVVDASKNTKPGDARGVKHQFAPTEARYVRCNILKNSSNPSVHLVEFKLYGEGTTPKPPPPPKPDAEGFVSLFNGKDLTGWTGSTKGYYVKDGVLICDPKKGGFLRTEKQYSDFAFRFDFKLQPGGNNGVSIRYPGKGSGAYAGMEIQILDNTAEKYAKLKPYQYHGSIYGIVPAKRGFLKPLGEWNTEEIRAKGSHITITLNGTVITDADLSKIDKPMDGKEHPGMRETCGIIGFMGHGCQVEFRNIKIKELK